VDISLNLPREFYMFVRHDKFHAEAQAVSEESWERFIPTVRKKGSSI
jgi:hypothetical protein